MSSTASTKPPKTKPSPARDRMLDLVEANSLRQIDEVTRALSNEDPFIRSAAVTALAKPAFKSRVADLLRHSDARVRLGALLASRRSRISAAASVIERALSDADEDVRLAAVLWAGEEQVRQVTSVLPRSLAGGNVAPELLRAYTAAAERLGKSGSTGTARAALTEVMIFPVTNAARPLNLTLMPRQSSAAAKPSSDADWRKALSTPGNVVSGKRLFYDASVGCAQCHRVEDHGGQLGPDLSVIGRIANRERIIDSILDPSKEIAPQFVQHTVATKGGDAYSGILLGQQADGTYTLLMNDGRGVVVPGALVASHETSKVSLMPDELEQGLTVEEFRDLVAFLLSLK